MAAGTVSAAPESWGTAPIETLLGLLEDTSRRLQVTLESLAMDEASYHRQYWSHWQTLTQGTSVAAMTRECERKCAPLNEMVILNRAISEALRVKRDGLVAALQARR